MVDSELRELLPPWFYQTDLRWALYPFIKLTCGFYQTDRAATQGQSAKP